MSTLNSPATSSKSLNAYLLGAGALTTMAATSSAVIVPIAIGNGPGEFDIGGINGGLSAGTSVEINNFPFEGGGTLGLNNADDPYDWNYIGLGLFATDANTVKIADVDGFGNPAISSSGDFIDNSLMFNGYLPGVAFYSDFLGAHPDIGPGSYIGFETITGNYGWLEVT